MSALKRFVLALGPRAVLALLALAASPACALDEAWRDCAQSDGKDWARAIVGCAKVLARGDKETAANRALALRNRGQAYFDHGDYDEAIADYSAAIALKPDYAAAHDNRGCAYLAKGDNDNAVIDENRALELDPKNAYAHVCRGLAYERKGDLAGALADFEAALSLKADDRWAIEGLARVKKALGGGASRPGEAGARFLSETQRRLKEQ